MTISTETCTDWMTLARQLGTEFAPRAVHSRRDGDAAPAAGAVASILHRQYGRGHSLSDGRLRRFGVAEAAYALALERAAKKRDDPQTPYLIGEMTNALVTAQMALEGMFASAANYDFVLVDETANAIFIRKTLAARAAIQTVEKAMELVGGAAFYRNVGLERLFRDVQGGLYHPYHEKRQHLFTGRLALGLTPVGER